MIFPLFIGTFPRIVPISPRFSHISRRNISARLAEFEPLDVSQEAWREHIDGELRRRFWKMLESLPSEIVNLWLIY
jgi:hypothetical protein